MKITRRFNYIIPSGINCGKTLLEVFSGNYDSTGICWEWTGKRFRNGYGCFYSRGRYLLAHRVQFEFANGVSPGGKVVRHECDNRACVNPKHLLLGSQKENMSDMIKRNRQNPCKGAASGNSKLDERKVLDIRMRADSGESFASISKRFKVSQKQISVICNRKQWRHI